ncbi:hypothetical protein F5Y10DRAFT_270424 [Nemania abortiva]|nr:hypothetical protein F5Y10DRAFT_270424 [Nemania abortiva]
MRYCTIFGSILALSASALAQVLDPTPGFSSIYFPRDGETIVAGTLYHVEWDADELVGPATLYLLGGDDPATLQALSTIAQVDVNNAEYRWPVDCSLGGQKIYLIKISWDGDNGETFGISPTFYIKGPNCYSSYGSPSSYPPKPIGYPAKPTSYPSAPTGYLSLSGGYPLESGGYPTQSATVISSSTYAETLRSTPEATVTDLSIVTLTPGSAPTGGPRNSTTLATPIATAGAIRAGAGLGLGLLAGALAL